VDKEIHVTTIKRPRRASKLEIIDRPKGQTSHEIGLKTVGNLLPGGYSSYIRIYHPFESIGDSKNVKTTKFWKDVSEQLSVPLESDTFYQLIMKYQEMLRKKYTIRYGDLEPSVKEGLLFAIASSEVDENVYFFYGVAAQISSPFHEEIAWVGELSQIDTVEEMTTAIVGKRINGPELIWPESRSWIVLSGYDVPSTYVACGESMAKQLMANPAIESCYVDLTTQLNGYH
jgi:hypothetical protein